MSRTLEWRELKTGTVALAVIIALVVSILLFARVGALHGDKSNIYVLTQDAEGVLEGTEVWLSGQKIGLVKDIHFRPVDSDTLQRLAIHTEILSNRMYLIRRDAFADIRPGDNLIGSPIVFISSGTSMAPALKSGDTLINKKLGKMKPVGAKVEDLLGRLSLLADTSKKALALLGSEKGTVGAFTHSGMAKLSDASATISSLLAKTNTGNGSLALASRGQLGARFAHIMAAKDSIALMLTTGNGNVGRFRRDSTLFRTVSEIRDEIDSLKVMASGGGGIQRAQTDTALKAQMAQIREQLTLLMADIKKHPTRYISF
jgi:phospholipid/cholesterol/gamma-HCH transport system substrate-binding protein